MARVTSLCVYCGSSSNVDPVHREAARRLGEELARRDIRLVYGGGRVGLMGICADAALAGGGRVLGIIPQHLDAAEVGHRGGELRIVSSMHERKQMMFEESDAFAILPGGIGTMDEAFEIITWRQLGLHDKPVVVVNEAGYWNPFLSLLDHIIESGFARPTIRRLYSVVEGVGALLPELLAEPEPKTRAQAAKM
ncbi:MAG: TIGR00730 family Rossman fold protein [Alphaproteobacteria bacterium]|nr:TIGR00730 family Rossman fold protein [Alphaproteobacteria bacterium]